jgi:hypothetical protein
MNDIKTHLALFDRLEPFSGYVPKGFRVDFLGRLTDARFLAMWGIDPAQAGGRVIATECPPVTSGEIFFEAVDWLAAAHEARGSYTMVTLGACYGVQALGAFRALQRIHPMPAKLVAVEAEPENFSWMLKNFRDNGLDPDEHWLINCALSDTNKPVLFPIGAPGLGMNNCFSTNHPTSRQYYAEQLMKHPDLPEVVRKLILDGNTEIQRPLLAGDFRAHLEAVNATLAEVLGPLERIDLPECDFQANLEFVSAITVADVLGPFDRVDLLECDIQQSEIVVLPPAMGLIKAKVKRVHLGTHGAEIHAEMLRQFTERGFEIVFNYEPDSEYQTEWGSFKTSDGIITAYNADL